MFVIRLALLLAGCLLLVQALAQQPADLKSSLESVPLLTMPRLDNEALRRAELAQRAPERPPRFAETFQVSVSPQTHGKWEHTGSGLAVWRLRVRSAGAHSLNLGFDQYRMPEGGALLLYTPDQSSVQGPFTPADNQEHAQLWTPIVEGDELIIEVQLPDTKIPELQLHLSSINHDFMGFAQMLSGSCNLDVICGAANGWAIVDRFRDIIQSVGLYALNGSTTCTGFLVNNTRNDCKPYFMTAFHCGVNANNAPSMVVYWNYQNSTCRQPGSPASGASGNGTLSTFTSGAVLRARFQATDFALVELTGQIPETANAYFAGWNRSNQTPQDTVIGIHHPSLEEKRISFEFNATYPGNWGAGSQNIPTGNHIIVPDWDIGTTEGGSSGSPLFNRRRQVVGQLHGGAAACGNDLYDSYGWLAFSWNGGGTPTSALRTWLDPDSTGVMEWDGRWARQCNFSVTPVIASLGVCAPDTARYTLVVSPNFEQPVSLSLNNVPPGAELSWSANPAMPGDTVRLIISNTAAITPGNYTMTLNASDSVHQSNSLLTLLVHVGMPTAPVLQTPEHQAQGVSLAPAFNWAAQQPGTRYQFQLARDAAFTQIVGNVNDLAGNGLNNQLLASGTTYYWRVRGSNLCGQGPWSEVRSFTTAVSVCSSRQATGLPIVIPSQGTPTINAVINYVAPGVVAGVKITGLDIRHTWVGDLRATLISPSGTAAVLFDRIGVPATANGCNGDDLFLSFEDAAPNTAQQLENMCNPSPPAASGNFQPLDAFTAFIGQTATGNWTLRINDLVNIDGGSLQAWRLEICTSLPHEARLFPAQTQFNLCTSDTLSFEMGIGTAFDSAGVELAVTGLPPGAQYAFGPASPVAPGQIVTVRIWGFPQPGNLSMTITAQTASGQTASAAIGATLRTTLPAAPLLSPVAGATAQPQNVTLVWGAVIGATGYRLRVARDSLFTQLVAEVTLPATSYNLQNLGLLTTYYWMVEVQNDCGWSAMAVPARFTTAGDLSLSATPTSISTCQSGGAVYTLSLGSGFLAPVTFVYNSTGAGTERPLLVFDTLDGQHIARVANLANLARGSYQITLQVVSADGATRTIGLGLTVETAPEFPVLTEPANNATLYTLTPTLAWSAAPGATSYLVEIARNELFTDLVIAQVTATPGFTPGQALAAGEYYWRVTARNDCGNATTAYNRFRLEPNSIYELGHMYVRIMPNPSPGQVFVQWSEPAPAGGTISICHINGQEIQRQAFEQGATRLAMHVEAYPPGVYLLRLQMGAHVLIHRVVRS